ncbi:MAG: hypothetical protein MSJ26_02565 [Oscillospiraceae bacterium]|nr:hypothetical protein [Oscillospiraceae bacterium]
MASSFFGLYVQRDGLQLAQKGLDITGHNITNIKTEGYSRQRLDVVSVANTAGCLGYNTQTTLAGKGADAVGVTQIRDKLLDAKVRRYSAELCDTGAKTNVLADIEDILDDVENDEAGLSAIFGQLKASFQSFSSTGADRQDLATVSMNSAESVINVIKNFNTRIGEVELATREDIIATNDRVNTILNQLASLNKQIKDAYVQMDNVFATRSGYQAEIDYGPLELKDSFNKLCDELSQYMNINVEQQADGTYDVKFADVPLVHNDSYAKTDIVFSDELEARNDFAELHISSLNSQKEWDKCEREITPAISAQPELEKMVKDLNEYIYAGKVKTACELERDIIGKANELGVDYSPIFINNKDIMSEKQIENLPTYAIEVTERTEKLSDGSISGLFDTYNGKGCYSQVGENNYNGIKYYQETIRSFANTMVREFNAIYDEYNNSDEAKALQDAAADKAEEKLRADVTAEYMDENGITDESALTDAQKAEIDAKVNETLEDVRAEAIEKTIFKLFEFEDGSLEDGSVPDLKIADTWRESVLRCVHPNVDADGKLDYNYDELDNAYINKILSVFEGKYEFGEEPDKFTFEGFIQYYGQTIGGDLEYELGNFDSTNIMLQSVSDARDEVMGVSMDEEGVNMMNYQKWYNAISRMISALDECLDKLINGTGKVGL